MYFALSVTYPVAAGLGGGGICLVHDPASGRNEEFDFLARNSASGGAFAVPGNVRGFAAMQSAFGVLASTVVGWIGGRGPVPMATVMFACAAIAFITYAVLVRRAD